MNTQTAPNHLKND